MSSSRSDNVTQFVIPSVPFFCLSVLGVCSALFQESFKGVSRKFLRCFKEDSRVFQGSFEGVSGSFKEVLRVFQGVSRVFQGSVKVVSREF